MDEIIHSEATLSAAVHDAIANTQVLDVHTHLFPASHGELMLWGVDALLTYHYLVSEFFMVAPDSISHKNFFAMQRSEQADLVWEHLFVRRLPLSEAALGVVTSLNALGLQEHVRRRDLAEIRKWFLKQDRSKHIQRVLALAGVDTVIMTNVPYDEREACVWRKGSRLPKGFKSALRVDLILTGDWPKLCQAMKKEKNSEYGLASGTELGVATLSGLRQYLEIWAKRMKPEYLMASTPAGFKYTEITWAQGLDVIESPSGIPTSNELIDKVLVPVALKLCLPLGIKIGAVRGMSPGLDPCGGGDGLEVVDLTFLRVLCLKHPQLKVLATVLSQSNQHELAVLAQKLRNLHIYGCWWYCNNPSMIEGITKMRMEMLGTNFTAQHSDARVLEQLIYKWKHSRDAISVAVITQHRKLIQAGWRITKGEVFEEVRSLLGGSYTAFTARTRGTGIPNVGSWESFSSEKFGSRPTSAEAAKGGGDPGRISSFSIQTGTSPRGHMSHSRDSTSPRVYDSPRGAGGLHMPHSRDSTSPSRYDSPRGAGGLHLPRSGSKEPPSKEPPQQTGLEPLRYELDNRISTQSPPQHGSIPPGRYPRINSSSSLTNHQLPMSRRPDSHANGSPMYALDPSTGADMPMC